MAKIIGRLVLLSILLLLAAAWYAQERYSNEALLHRYHLEPDLLLIEKAVSNTDLLAAVDAYRIQSYQVSDSLLLDLLPDDPDFVFGEYLLGHSYLKNERISNAILSFESVRDFGISPVQDDATWMTVMALITKRKDGRSTEYNVGYGKRSFLYA
jgi:hypothetical protein